MTDIENPKIGGYSFEELQKLAESDPEKFEQERTRIINSFLETVPEEKRLKLRQLQFRVDGVRRKYIKNGLACTQKMYDEMLISFYELNDVLQSLKVEKPKPKLKLVRSDV